MELYNQPYGIGYWTRLNRIGYFLTHPYNESFGGTSVAATHDNNGNLTADAWYKYTYDAWNRLVKVTTKGDPEGGNVTIATYTYDATGRRMKKVVSNSGDRDGTQYYYYAGARMIETRNGSELATRQFVFGTQYVDEPIRMDADNDGDGDCMDTFGSEFYYYHQDANYNVVALTDSDGAVVQRYLYDSYGRLHVYDAFDTASPDRGDLASGEVLDPLINPSPGITVPNPFTYTGRFHDIETGNYYYRARHYQPNLGRFLQRDPFAFRQPSDFLPSDHYHDSLNLYEYVASRPTSLSDPSGQFIGKIIACIKCAWKMRGAAQKCDQNTPRCSNANPICEDAAGHAVCLANRNQAIRTCIQNIANAIPDCVKCGYKVK